MTVAFNSPGIGNFDADDLALDLVRDRLAGLGRQYSPIDVATAMRAEGLVVSDSAVLDTVESLRRHRVGAGPLEPLLKEPGVTDVLVNGTDHVFIDRGARARADGRSISMRTRRAPACLASGSLCRPASRRDATADNGEGGQGRAPGHESNIRFPIRVTPEPTA
jgi:hypothetical protein